MPNDEPPTATASAAGTPASGRSVGLFGATSIGVGAIVGGGILALAGVAFGSAGPSAIVAFVLNAVIALLTALSFAELAASFPQSGGSYTFAKRVLSVRSAFTLGWIVYFASIVAGVLYALGFAEYALIALAQLLPNDPAWLGGRASALALAGGATVAYTVALTRSAGGGGDWATIGKVIVFAGLIVAGLIALPADPATETSDKLRPFFAGGALGVFQAMGFTFIAFQGFDLIAAAGGEIRAPGRTIPRAMLLSLGVAVAVYLPLLFVIATVGVPAGESVTELSRRFPETLVAVSASTFLGPVGFWLVVVAALLSMLSALQANLFAASRIAQAMARDHTLPRRLGRVDARGIPVDAVLTSAATLVLLLFLLPDVAAAGAAASLIFLAVFTLTHGIAVLARRRAGDTPLPFRTPLFPAVPVVGGLACAVLALFQGITVPAAGVIALVWIAIGVAIYLRLFAQRARARDAHEEGRDPRLVQLRGRSPLVLVPIANPASAGAMVAVASALTPPRIGRVLLLNVVVSTTPSADGEAGAHLVNSQSVLRASLLASFETGLFPEALTTVATDPWAEIARVARTHSCESLLLGFSELEDGITGRSAGRRTDELISAVDSDVVVLYAPPGWRLDGVERVLIPIAGRGDQEVLRARLLGSLGRLTNPEVTYLRVVPTSVSEASRARAERGLGQLAEDRRLGAAHAEVVRHDHPLEAIAERAERADLMILGLQRHSRQQKTIGEFARKLAAVSYPHCAVVMISRRG